MTDLEQLATSIRTDPDLAPRRDLVKDALATHRRRSAARRLLHPILRRNRLATSATFAMLLGIILLVICWNVVASVPSVGGDSSFNRPLGAAGSGSAPLGTLPGGLPDVVVGTVSPALQVHMWVMQDIWTIPEDAEPLCTEQMAWIRLDVENAGPHDRPFEVSGKTVGTVVTTSDDWPAATIRGGTRIDDVPVRTIFDGSTSGHTALVKSKQDDQIIVPMVVKALGGERSEGQVTLRFEDGDSTTEYQLRVRDCPSLGE